MVRQGVSNGCTAKRIILDTGSSLTLVHRKFVPHAANSEKTMTTRSTTGTQSYPTAVVVIELDGHRYEREVAVSEQLRKDTLLGVNVPLWPHLVKSVDTNKLAQIKSLIEQEETSYTVTTRAQARRSDLQRELEQNVESVVEPDAIVDTEGSTTETIVSPASNQPSNSETGLSETAAIDETEVNQSDVSHVFPFHDTLFSSNRDKVYKTRAERRRCQQKNRQDDRVSREELIRDQENDSDIQKWSDQVKPIYKRVISGVLCRRWRPLNNLSESCDQIVLPKGQRHHALKLAHDIPMAGHLGRDCILDRLRKHFWWPEITHDVAEYCCSCPECQSVKMWSQGTYGSHAHHRRAI